MNKLAMALLMACLLSACVGAKSENEGVQDRLNTKELKYFTNGKRLYTQYCNNCHMDNGEGLGRLIPPLAKSDYLMEDLGRAAKIMKYGQKGPIAVNGTEYNQPMPANPQLTPLEILQILAYVSNTWGNEADIMTLPEVQDALKEQ
tara:strand:- start:1460 stop:1897 length:438 start_codon:yes stop_codon:yes gene_type:complete